ncbi:MAG: TatD family hydrolase, partial [Thiotrichaceae bacterium]|nr:TatD family hydrolase [Thiotrichaceae bacterium]
MKFNKQTLIDTHCHFDFPVFDKHRENILNACEKQSLKQIVVPGVCAQHWQRILQLSQKYQAIYPALGLHPCFLHEHQQSDLQGLKQLCETESLVAIGEIGLDYYNRADKTNAQFKPSSADKEKQNWYFSQQLQLAGKHCLPVLIHARRAHNDVLE